MYSTAPSATRPQPQVYQAHQPAQFQAPCIRVQTLRHPVHLSGHSNVYPSLVPYQRVVVPVSAAQTTVPSQARTVTTVQKSSVPVRPATRDTALQPPSQSERELPQGLPKALIDPADALVAGLLPHIEKKLAHPDERTLAYMSFLSAISGWGLLDGLRRDRLRIGFPFCGQLSEAPFLLPFLAEQLLDAPSATLQVVGSEVDPVPASFWWPAWRAWAATQPWGDRIQLEFHVQDSSQVTLPAPHFDLLVGVHPQLLESIASVTTSGDQLDVQVKDSSLWHDIIANTVRSCAGGALCIFATFFLSEAKAVKAILEGLGISCEIKENPMYVGLPWSTPDTHLRFVVAASIPASGE